MKKSKIHLKIVIILSLAIMSHYVLAVPWTTCVCPLLDGAQMVQYDVVGESSPCCNGQVTGGAGVITTWVSIGDNLWAFFDIELVTGYTAQMMCCTLN